MKIAILGFGNVGQHLAKLFSSAGHEVTIGLKQGSSGQHLAYKHGSFEEVARASELIVLALPYTACGDILPNLATAFAGKIVVDSTNPLNADWSPLLLGQENSATEEISRLIPQARVVKAFNTIFADVMQPERQVRDGLRITAFVCGDDVQAKQSVMQLANDSGFAALDVGPLSSARYLESLAHLNIQIAVGQDGGTNAAFLYHQIPQTAS